MSIIEIIFHPVLYRMSYRVLFAFAILFGLAGAGLAVATLFTGKTQLLTLGLGFGAGALFFVLLGFVMKWLYVKLAKAYIVTHHSPPTGKTLRKVEGYYYLFIIFMLLAAVFMGLTEAGR